MNKSAIDMGTMTIIQTLPAILFGAVIGTIADKIDSRKLLYVTLIVQVIFLLILLFLFENSGNMYPIYLVGFLLSVDRQFFKATIFTLIPVIFKDPKKGNSEISSVNSLATIVSPIVGAGVISFTGVPFTIFLNMTFTFLFLIYLLLGLKIGEGSRYRYENIDKISIISGTREGFHFIKESKVLREIIIIALISNLADAGLVQLLIYYLSDNLNVSQSVVSVIIGISGVGGLLGAFFPRIFKNMSDSNSIKLGILLNNLGIFLLLLNEWRVIAISLLISRMGGMYYVIMQNTIIHRSVNKEMYGRVNGIISNISEISTPISVFILMWVANSAGGYVALVVSGVLTVIVTVLCFVFKFCLKEGTYENSNY